jgi:hypothetical protein
MKDECGDEIPEEIVAKAKAIGCIKDAWYVYRDGRYGKKRPAVSLGCQKAARFRSDDFQEYKVLLGDGYVAFRSPSSIMATFRSRFLVLVRHADGDGRLTVVTWPADRNEFRPTKLASMVMQYHVERNLPNSDTFTSDRVV